MAIHGPRFALTCCTAATAISSAERALAQVTPTTDNSRPAIETVTVTAEKRTEALVDVPMSVTALTLIFARAHSDNN